MENIDLKFLKREMELLVLSSSSVRNVLRYLRSRKKTATSSDLNKVAINARSHTGDVVSAKDLHVMFGVFSKAGLGVVEKKERKYKFRWKYWVFPLFDREMNCFGLDVRSMQSLRKHSYSFKNAAMEAESKEKDYCSIDKRKTVVCDVVLSFAQKNIEPTPLCDYTLEDLAGEIQKRGYKITIETI